MCQQLPNRDRLFIGASELREVSCDRPLKRKRAAFDELCAEQTCDQRFRERSEIVNCIQPRGNLFWFAHGIAKRVRKDRLTLLSDKIDGGREVAGMNAVKQKRRDFVLACYWNSVMLTQSRDALKHK